VELFTSPVNFQDYLQEKRTGKQLEIHNFSQRAGKKIKI
jgi:hypothetical protein